MKNQMNLFKTHQQIILTPTKRPSQSNFFFLLLKAGKAHVGLIFMCPCKVGSVIVNPNNNRTLKLKQLKGTQPSFILFNLCFEPLEFVILVVVPLTDWAELSSNLCHA